MNAPGSTVVRRVSSRRLLSHAEPLAMVRTFLFCMSSVLFFPFCLAFVFDGWWTLTIRSSICDHAMCFCPSLHEIILPTYMPIHLHTLAPSSCTRPARCVPTHEFVSRLSAPSCTRTASNRMTTEGEMVMVVMVVATQLGVWDQSPSWYLPGIECEIIAT